MKTLGIALLVLAGIVILWDVVVGWAAARFLGQPRKVSTVRKLLTLGRTFLLVIGALVLSVLSLGIKDDGRPPHRRLPRKPRFS